VTSSSTCWCPKFCLLSSFYINGIFIIICSLLGYFYVQLVLRKFVFELCSVYPEMCSLYHPSEWFMLCDGLKILWTFWQTRRTCISGVTALGAAKEFELNSSVYHCLVTSVNELKASAHHIKGCWQVFLCGWMCSVWSSSCDPQYMASLWWPEDTRWWGRNIRRVHNNISLECFTWYSVSRLLIWLTFPKG